MGNSGGNRSMVADPNIMTDIDKARREYVAHETVTMDQVFGI